MKSFVNVVLIGGLFFCFCCAGENSEPPVRFKQWIEDERHGLVKVKEIDNVRLTLQWIPPDWRIYRDFSDAEMLCPDQKRDSLRQVYRQSLAFLLTVESTNSQEDMLWKNTATEEEFRIRLHQLTFRMNEFIRLEAEGEVFRPVLHSLENDYGLRGARKVHLIFSDAERYATLLNAKQYDVVFEDELFMTGLSHFIIKRNQMEEIPSLEFRICN